MRDMKVLIVSDIHGRLAAAHKFETVIQVLCPDKIIALGDFLYNGPRNGVPSDYDPMAVADILNKYADRIIGIRGNCDSRIDEQVLRFPLENSRVMLIDGCRCDLIHGDIISSELVDVRRGDIMMFGHTHLFMLKKQEGLIYLNPGSISFPKQGNPPTYAYLEDKKIAIKSLETGESLLTMTIL